VNPQAYYGDASYRARYVHTKFRPETIAKALRRTRGGIAATARALQCSRTTIQRYLSVYPTLRELADEERELALDLAQHSLYVDAAAGEPRARKFLLLTLGRDRGFVLRREVTGATGQPWSSPHDNGVIVIRGDKQEYMEGLRRLREAARASLQVTSSAVDERPAVRHGTGVGGGG
jgi:hypothetical protein